MTPIAPVPAPAAAGAVAGAIMEIEIEIEAGGLGQATSPEEREARGGPGGRREQRARVLTRDAFTAAVADHHRELARFAFRLCGDRTAAEDIVAEAYARVWVHWRKGRIDVLLPYLMRTVANEAYARQRRWRLAQRKELPAVPAVEGPFEDRVDDHDQLWSAIGRLAPQQRVVLVLRIVEDLSEEQTAAMLGIPPGTVKSRLSRALAMLRTIVEGSHV